jgi:hypothetical protein
MERLVLLGSGEEVELGELPANLTAAQAQGGIHFSGDIVSARELHHRYALWALEQLGGNKARTADKLHVDVRTVGKWLGGNDAEES